MNETKTVVVKEVLEKTTRFFSDKGIETSRLDAELLLSSALQWDRVKLYLNYLYPLNPVELQTCRDYVRRRAAGEPVAYILGQRGFYKHDFLVSPAVLIPRPETEKVVEDTLAWFSTQSAADETQNLIDLGTGSGCIGLSLLAELPNARLLAVDLSQTALEIAKRNAERLGVADRVTFVCSDAGQLTVEQVQECFSDLADAVVANPPYIAIDDPEIQPAVRKFEPEMALFSADSGLCHVRAWLATALRVCRPGARIMFEIGMNQGQAAHEIFSATARLSRVAIEKDLSGRDRYVVSEVREREPDQGVHHG